MLHKLNGGSKKLPITKEFLKDDGIGVTKINTMFQKNFGLQPLKLKTFDYDTLKSELFYGKKKAFLTMITFEKDGSPFNHVVVVCGARKFKDKNGNEKTVIIYNDPAKANGSELEMSLRKFSNSMKKAHEGIVRNQYFENGEVKTAHQIWYMPNANKELAVKTG